MKFLVYPDRRGQWRWSLRAKNGKKIAVSSEAYRNFADCCHSINLVKLAFDAPVSHIPKRSKETGKRKWLG